MTTRVRTIECFPEVLGAHLMFDPGPPRHDQCPGSFHTPGVIGGWNCSCPCHQNGALPAAVSGETPER